MSSALSIDGRQRLGARRWLLGTLALLLSAANVPGLQPQTVNAPEGRIAGKVFSMAPDGRRYFIANSEVVLAPTSGAHALGGPPIAVQTTSTNADGEYAFKEVPMGCFTITASAPNMSAHGRETCLLTKGAGITVDIEMTLAVVKSSVDVSASVEGIETTESSAAGAIGSPTLQAAPSVTEQFDTYLTLLPGVIRGPGDVVNLKGARTAQSGVLVNDTNATDPYSGSQAINVPIDVISSVRVLSNPYDSEYGNFAGAISAVNTNISDFSKLHFKLNNFVPGLKRRDDHWAGFEKFIPRVTVTAPLVRDRIAITQSVEYRFNRPEVKKANLPPLQNDTKIESLNSFTRADFQISNRHTAAVDLSFYPQKQIYVGLDTFTPQMSTPDLRQRGYLLEGEDQYAFKSGGLISSKISYKTFDMDVRPNGDGAYQRGLETTVGSFFNRQQRETTRFAESETFHFAPLSAAGQHSFKAGWRFARETYDGLQVFSPVAFLGISDRPVARIGFTSPARLNFSQNQYTLFFQDKWTLWRRLTVDAGVRFDRDSIAEEGHFAPRVGFAYVLTGDNKTVLRGGFGQYYDRINLNIASFLSLPARTETRFSPLGAVTASTVYEHRLQNPLRDPRSASWSVQLDREVTPNLFVRAGFQQRITARNFVLNPDSTVQGDFLTLSNNGWDRYREFEVTGRYRLRQKGELTVSYVHSSTLGNTNDFNTYFGNVPQPLIRGDERTRLDFDAPNRLLTWATFNAPFKMIISPVVDIHTGFPYSIVDESRDFVGRRNRAGRFRTFASADLEILRPFRVPLIPKPVNIGMGIFNLLNRFNPIDVQNNLASRQFGIFTQSRDRVIAMRLRVGF